MKRTLLVLATLCLLGIGFLFVLFREGERVVGEIPVLNGGGLYFTIYQDQEFDSSTGVYYDIRDNLGKLLSEKFILTGTLDYENAADYAAYKYDNFIYLSYLGSHRVVAIYDLKSKYGFPRSSDADTVNKWRRGAALLDSLRQRNPRIVDGRVLEK